MKKIQNPDVNNSGITWLSGAFFVSLFSSFYAAISSASDASFSSVLNFSS
jgi:hypothetical protein